MSHTVFITGATGNIGAPLLSRLIQSPEVGRIYVLVRAESQAAGIARIERAVQVATGECDEATILQKVEAACGDITSPRLGLSPVEYEQIAKSITHVVHCAAQTQFTLPLECARRTNLEGTQQVAGLAREAQRLGTLQHVVHVSTAYVCGPKHGVVTESDPLPDQFSNSYEQTKAETERWLADACSDLPITVVRPSIVVGDSVTGRILSCNVLYTPLRWILRHQSAGPTCPPETPLDVVSVDYVADAIAYLLLHKPDGRKSPIHLTAGTALSMTVGEVVTRAYELARTTGCFPPQNRGAIRSSLLDPFAPYVRTTRAFDRAHADAALEGSGIVPRPLTEYLSAILRYCFATDWGKHPLAVSGQEERRESCAA